PSPSSYQLSRDPASVEKGRPCHGRCVERTDTTVVHLREAVAGAHRRTEGGRSQRVRTVRAALETELASRLTNGERDGHVRSHVLLARLDGRRGGLCGERRCAVVHDRRRGGALLVDSRDLTEGEGARV